MDCSDEAVANLALLNELLEAEMNFITSGSAFFTTIIINVVLYSVQYSIQLYK